jgi:hypothetical protein
LKARAALKEKYLVVLRHVQKLSKAVARGREDSLEMVRTVTDLHHAHPDTVQRKQFALCLFQNGMGQNRGPGTKIEDFMIQSVLRLS